VKMTIVVKRYTWKHSPDKIVKALEAVSNIRVVAFRVVEQSFFERSAEITVEIDSPLVSDGEGEDRDYEDYNWLG
jgi:hypothetical protein